MKTPLPMNFVDLALGAPAPRWALAEGNIPIDIRKLNLITIAGLPVYPTEEITLETPFEYELISEGVVDTTRAANFYEKIRLKPRSARSKKSFISLVKQTLCRDLIVNGLPVTLFTPEVRYQYHGKNYTFHIEDLKALNTLRYPVTVDSYIVDRMHELSNLANKTTYIPCTHAGTFELFAAQHKCGKDLFQKYVSAVHKYNEVRNTFLRLIDEYNFASPQTATDLWYSLYNTKEWTGEIERVQL